jgi:ABC-type transport system involved in cytochrome bd biosynthesis fused ATPase/permease subunit
MTLKEREETTKLMMESRKQYFQDQVYGCLFMLTIITIVGLFTDWKSTLVILAVALIICGMCAIASIGQK